MKNMPKINVSVGFVLLITAALCFELGNVLVLALAASAVHEMAHLAVIYACGGRAEEIRLAIYGAYIKLCGYPMMSYKKELLIAAAGPFASGVCAYLLSVLGKEMGSQQIFVLSGIDLMLALLNLLPAYPLDGGRILRCALMLAVGEDRADAVCLICCGVCALALCAGCVYINMRMGFQLSLTVFCAFVVCAFIRNVRA